MDRVRDADLAAFAHDDLPFDLLVEDLNPERSFGRHPFFQVMVSTQTAQDTTVRLGGTGGTLDGADLAAAKFDLGFHCAETWTPDGEPAAVLIGLQYATDLYDEETAHLLLGLFGRALLALAEQAGDTPLSAVDLLDDAGRAALDRRHEALENARGSSAADTDGTRQTPNSAAADPVRRSCAASSPRCCAATTPARTTTSSSSAAIPCSRAS
ncbi:condensation domain-containing protein [Streptomyces zhihengii]